MYNYHIAADCKAATWKTSAISDFLHSQGNFSESSGCFFCQSPYLDIFLLKAENPKSLNHLDSLDYDSCETNYISIITSKKIDDNEHIKKILHGLERMLCSPVCCDA